MFSFPRFIAVARKELLELRRNILFFLMTILAPAVFYFLFAYGFPLDVKHLPMGVVDLDASAPSRSLIDAFEQAAGIFDVKLVTADVRDADRAMALGDIRMILTIPRDYGQRLRAGWPVDVQAAIDGAYPNVASIAGANAEAIVGAVGFEALTKHLLVRPGLEAAGVTFTPVDLSVSTWYNPSFRSEDFIVPAIIALVMVFFPPIVAALALAREKETGSILNMYCSSLTRAEYLLGKVAPYLVIASFNLLVFLALSVWLFEVPLRGSLATLVVSGVVYIAAVIGVGLFVAVLVKSQVAAILITFVGTVMPAFLFSGFMVPMSSMEPGAQWMGRALPTTSFIDLIRKVMVKGADIGVVWVDVAVLAVTCLAIYSGSILLFKKRVG